MDFEEIKYRIDIIFEFQEHNREFPKKQSNKTTYKIVKGGKNPFSEQNEWKTYTKYENCEYLLKLYNANVSEDLKNEFLKYVSSKIYDIENIVLTTYFLHKLKRYDTLFEKCFSSQFSAYGLKLSLFCDIWNYILSEEYQDLPDDILKNLKLILKKLDTESNGHPPNGLGYSTPTKRLHNENLYNLHMLVNQVQMERLKLKLDEGINTEINEDLIKLKKSIKEYGFNQELNEVLDKIDNDYYKYSEDEFEIKKSIDLLREFFNRYCDQIIDNVGTISTKKFKVDKDLKDPPRVQKHKYLSKNFNLTEGEGRTLKAVNKMLNEEVHHWKSKREKFRITKNFVIEFCLMLSIKFEQFKFDFKN
ncbi:hypothetical protein [Methanococcus maripaludis]|uniref:Uncharacterized protein n=1 Tax=Methanococcus maripaludis TaxID=39152 RepID=A0A2L1C9F1_METMI|nr:hypothetical protein [Methanococcus maripaludis]AVB75984.1 hypothetical protein MMJJ_05670 [Methanococcus maripaludis]